MDLAAYGSPESLRQDSPTHSPPRVGQARARSSCLVRVGVSEPRFPTPPGTVCSAEHRALVRTLVAILQRRQAPSVEGVDGRVEPDLMPKLPLPAHTSLLSGFVVLPGTKNPSSFLTKMCFITNHLVPFHRQLA